MEESPRAKRLLLGDPLTSEKLDDQLLPKRRALPIFASDALSSVAYAPQELLMILLIGGTAFLAFSPGVAVAVVVLLIVVVLSYRQLIKAYPSGGGDYEVARTNLGEVPGVVGIEPRYTQNKRIAFNFVGSPFENKKLRQAVAHAVNRDEMVQAIYFGLADHATVTVEAV